jgi:hypothetical protein
MKRVTLLCVDSERDRTLVLLRDFGFVELDLSNAKGAEFAAGKADLEKAERAARIALKAAWPGVSRKVIFLPAISTW